MSYKKSIGIILLISIILTLNSLIVFSDYETLGNYDGYYNQGQGNFNSQLSQSDIVISNPRTITTPEWTPMVADLDGDGTNEIIQIDGANVRLYQNITLDILDSFSLDSADRYSNVFIYDLDNDNLSEIMFASETDLILHILEFNGTFFTNQSSLPVYLQPNVGDGEMMIGCDTDIYENCVLFHSEDIDNAPNVLKRSSVMGFNSTNLGTAVALRANTYIGTETTFCFPKIRNVVVADYDGDGQNNYIMSQISFTRNVHDDLLIDYISMDENLTITSDLQITDTSPPNYIGSTPSDCETLNGGKYFTSPSVADYDGSSSNGLETVIAYMIDDNEFNIEVWDKNGNTVDTFPALTDADGEIVSNVIKGNFFSDTGDIDFCVMGYQHTDEEIDLLCASLQTSEGVNQNRQFFATTSYNVSLDYQKLNTVAHASVQSASDSPNLDEIVFSYGVAQLDTSGIICSTTGICVMDQIFENPKGDAVVIPTDYENLNRADLLVLTSTNLWYIDDGFVNQDGSILNYTINPCIDSTWKLNTTASINIQVIDPDEDLVSARAILYQGESNEQDSGWQNNATNGTWFSFSFNVNSTTPASNLRLMGRDTTNFDNIDIINVPFSVNTNGLEHGDCITTVFLGSTTTTGENLLADGTDLDNNAVKTGMTVLGETVGFGPTTTYFFLLCILFLAIWFISESQPREKLGAMSVIGLTWIILGAMIEIVSTGIIITLVVMGIIIIGIIGTNKFSGTNNN